MKAEQVERVEIAAGVVWQVAPGEEAQWPTWIACRDRWLAAKARRSRSDHTRRAYGTAWGQFFAWVQVPPWAITPGHAAAWVEYLADGEGLSAATVNARIAALSSFYSFASEQFTVPEDGTVKEKPLWEGVNPFRRVDRPDVDVYAQATYPTQAEVERLLGAMDLDTARGWRDRAIVLGLVTMAQRFSAWLNVTWGQVHEGDGGMWFEYRAKGGHRCKAAIPGVVWQAVEQWLHRSGRWPLAEEDYLFVAEDPARATRLPNVAEAVENRPLSNATVNGILKTLARRAGLDEGRVHAHGLRHAGARAMRAAGADPWDLQRVLGHKSLATTARYTEEVLDEPSNPFGSAVAEQLRLDL